MKLEQLKIILMFAISTNMALLQSVQANPNGASVVSGEVSFSQPDLNTLEITNSPNAIINWQQFDINSNETTRFIQQSDSSAVLNRVVSGDMSEILGQLESNGTVYLINPNGLVVGQGASIDTAGFIGSTLNITDDDFLNGRLHFEGQGAGDIDNQGFIRAGNNGDILLIAPNITNSGVLQVDGGNILLAAGESITISNIDNADISFEIQSPDNSVTNLGQIIANNGAASLFAGTLTHSGSISANGITQDAAGNIRLVAQDTNWIEGEVIATGNIGGDIELLGEQVGLDGNAIIDASGTNGGGRILIGGDYQGQGDIQTARASYVGEGVQIKANALDNGDGGTVVVWSDESTRMYGSISATGGALSGDGGLIETSGGYLDVGVNAPDVGADNGEGGTWLIDPHNITIVAGLGNTGIPAGDPFISTGNDAQLGVDLIAGAITNGDVIIKTSDSAGTQAGDIIWDTGVILEMDDILLDQSLTLEAHNNIIFNGQTQFVSSANQSLDLIIIADSDGDGAGSFTLGSTAILDLGFGTGPLSDGLLDVTAANDIIIDGVINTNGGSINLKTTGGSINQTLITSNIITANLVTSSLGNTTLSGSNIVSNFGATVGSGSDITFDNRAALTIDSIDASGGTVKLNNTSTIDQTGAIVAGTLDILADGDVFLTNAGNDVDTLFASTSTAASPSISFEFVDLDDLEVGTVSVINNSTSLGSAFLDIRSGGDMTLNGAITASGLTVGSGITLNAQNGGDIIYQSGVLTSDAINFQNDANATTTGAVGSALNLVLTAASNTDLIITHGANDPDLSGGDLYLLNTSGGLTLQSYMTQAPSALQLVNSAGNIDLSSTILLDDLGNPTSQLTASSVFLKAAGDLLLPTDILATRDVYLEGADLTIGLNNTVNATGNVMLVANTGGLSIQNVVDSTAGNVELHADAFNITAAVTAQNQVVIRDIDSLSGLEVNDGLANAGFATLTTTDLGFLTGTNLGILLGNNLVSGTKTIQVVSDIDSTMINGTALTLDTTLNSAALITANVDFTAGNENLIFTGNGTASIEASGVGNLLVDTGTGSLISSATQLTISGLGSNAVDVKTNNAGISGDLTVASGSLAGSSALFQGNNLALTNGSVLVSAIGDSAAIEFGDVNIAAENVSVSGGDGNNAFATIGSTAGGATLINATGSIILQDGLGVDADAFLSGGGGQGAVVLNYDSCTGCDTLLSGDPLGNGQRNVGVYSAVVALNGNLSGSGLINLDPVPELSNLFDIFLTEYVEPVIGEGIDEDSQLICR